MFLQPPNLTSRWFQRVPVRRGVVGGSSRHQHIVNIFVRLNQAAIQDFQGDYVVTSTNRKLEGNHRRHWWGFAGRRGVDDSLHQVYLHSKSYPEYLVRVAQQQQQQGIGQQQQQRLLEFAECLVTPAGPLLPKIGYVIHTCVPRYPLGVSSNDLGGDSNCNLYATTTLPHARVGTREEALCLLRDCYRNVFHTILQKEHQQRHYCNDNNWWTTTMMKTKSWWWPFFQSTRGNSDKELTICLPTIGCGYNGYPIRQAATIALDFVQVGMDDLLLSLDHNQSHHYHETTTTTTTTTTNLWIEIRCLERRVLEVWKEELEQRVPGQFQLATE